MVIGIGCFWVLLGKGQEPIVVGRIRPIVCGVFFVIPIVRCCSSSMGTSASPSWTTVLTTTATAVSSNPTTAVTMLSRAIKDILVCVLIFDEDVAFAQDGGAWGWKVGVMASDAVFLIAEVRFNILQNRAVFSDEGESRGIGGSSGGGWCGGR